MESGSTNQTSVSRQILMDSYQRSRVAFVQRLLPQDGQLCIIFESLWTPLAHLLHRYIPTYCSQLIVTTIRAGDLTPALIVTYYIRLKNTLPVVLDDIVTASRVVPITANCAVGEYNPATMLAVVTCPSVA
jgi:hypothetical protein